MYQGCNSRGVFSKLSNFPLSTMWRWTSTDLDVLVHFHIVERGKLESLESLENIPNFPNFFRGLKRPLQFFYRDASSTLLQLVNQWLNFTYSRSHAFRYERKNTNPTLVRIELTTSVLLADVQLTY